jgi:hypothetical protein
MTIISAGFILFATINDEGFFSRQSIYLNLDTESNQLWTKLWKSIAIPSIFYQLLLLR